MEEYSIDTDQAYQHLLDFLSTKSKVAKPNNHILIVDNHKFYLDYHYTLKLYSEFYREKYYKIVDESNLEEFLDHIDKHELLAFDTETTGLDVHSDIVIGFSVSGMENVGYYFPIYSYINDRLEKIACADYHEILRNLKKKKLIMHNGSYDVRIVKNNLCIDLVDSLYCDTILLKHTLDEEKPFGLKDIAIKIQDKLGLDMEKAANEEQIALKENIKAKGGSVTKTNFEMYKADLKILGTYAASDTDLTLRIFNYYSKLLKEQGSEEFFYNTEIMPMYKKVVIKMEEKGVVVDVDLLKQTYNAANETMDNLKKEILNDISEYVSKFEKWYLDKNYKTTKNGKFGQALVSLKGLELPKTKTGKFGLGKKNLETLEDSVYKSFLLGEGELNDQTIYEVKHHIYQSETTEPMFNIGSKDHLKTLFFDCMNETPLDTTPSGKAKFDDNTIEHFAEKYEWCKKLRNYNKLVKIQGTYIGRYLDKQKEGVLYPAWMMHRTVTGRLGGDLMQLPRVKDEDELKDVDPLVIEYNNKIRNCIIAGKGYKLVGADYSSLEVVVFADDSEEEVLLDIIRKKHDFYSSLAIGVFNMPEYSADKKAPNFLKKKNPLARTRIKPIALGLRYGEKPYKIHKELNISKQEAQKIYDDYFNFAPNLKKRMKELENFAKKHGYVRSKGGRIKHCPDLKKYYDLYGDILKDHLALWKKYHRDPIKYAEMKQKAKEYNGMINAIYNFPIQSMGASICSRACIAIADELIKKNLDAYICMQVHDELVVRCAEDIVDEVAKIIQDKMENTTKLSVPLEAIPEIGDRYGDIK